MVEKPSIASFSVDVPSVKISGMSFMIFDELQSIVAMSVSPSYSCFSGVQLKEKYGNESIMELKGTNRMKRVLKHLLSLL